ncbi:MAG: AAA family ATPase [Planctomycetota bacterium]
MIINRIKLGNWRNFRTVDVALGRRVFVIGPNASGKSNFLDVFRFLRDVAKPGGGLQTAISDRGGLSKIRCLAARKYPDVEIAVELSSEDGKKCVWKYEIGVKQQKAGLRRAFLSHERVWKDGKQILDRPDDDDKKDEARLTQTHLEQVNANQEFREIAELFESISYLHVVPQILRNPKAFTGPGLPGDPFGRQLLERVAKTPEKTRKSRLKRIEAALRYAVPQLKELSYEVDTPEGGIPHLEAVYEHWRPHGAKQREVDFSDGTLRLIGLLWSLQEGQAPLLLEEPELSLNGAIVRKLPSLIHQATRKNKRQVLISTHSADLLSDKGIGSEETLLLFPDKEGTRVEPASDEEDIRQLLQEGLSIAEAALPRIEPKNVHQLFFDYNRGIG